MMSNGMMRRRYLLTRGLQLSGSSVDGRPLSVPRSGRAATRARAGRPFSSAPNGGVSEPSAIPSP